MPEVKNEPTVSVHGVPKSQYEAGAVPSSVGGFDKKWILWIGLGIVGVIILFMFLGGGIGASTANTSTNPSGGSGNANLDSELNQLQSEIDQLLGKGKGGGGGQPPPKKKKKDNDALTGGLPLTNDSLHHVVDTHGFASHQRLG